MEEAPSEIKDKIEPLKDRILQYRNINLSIRGATNSLHKVLAECKREFLKDTWISVINTFF